MGDERDEHFHDFESILAKRNQNEDFGPRKSLVPVLDLLPALVLLDLVVVGYDAASGS